MRIGCLQFAPQVGDVNNNLNRADAVLSRADPGDLDLLVLPELAFSGYNFKSLRDISPFLEPSGAGVTSLWARTTALKYECTVITGYPEKVDVTDNWPANPEYYNSAIVINPDGETIGNYQKTHLYYTDETWALEGPSGFFAGRLPGLGRTAMGICMDIKFQSPWDKFEFAHHALDYGAHLIIVPMAWLTHENPREYTRMPQEPDMQTLMYWVSRLEPIVRLESEHEVIVIFANRSGMEDEVMYAGSSTVIGIKNGEVLVYGILGRGDKELLVVDTDAPPFARLVQTNPSPAVPSGAQDTQKPDDSESSSDGDSIEGPPEVVKDVAKPSSEPPSSVRPGSSSRQEKQSSRPATSNNVRGTGGLNPEPIRRDQASLRSQNSSALDNRDSLGSYFDDQPSRASSSNGYLNIYTNFAFDEKSSVGKTPDSLTARRGSVSDSESHPPGSKAGWKQLSTRKSKEDDSRWNVSDDEDGDIVISDGDWNSDNDEAPAGRGKRNNFRSDSSVWNNVSGRSKPGEAPSTPKSQMIAQKVEDYLRGSTPRSESQQDLRRFTEFSSEKKSEAKSRHQTSSRAQEYGTPEANTPGRKHSGLGHKIPGVDSGIRTGSAKATGIGSSAKVVGASTPQRRESRTRTKAGPSSRSASINTTSAVRNGAVSRSASIPIAMDMETWNASRESSLGRQKPAAPVNDDLPILRPASRSRLRAGSDTSRGRTVETPLTKVMRSNLDQAVASADGHKETRQLSRGRQRGTRSALDQYQQPRQGPPRTSQSAQNTRRTPSETIDLSQFHLIEEFPSANCPVHGSRSRSAARHGTGADNAPGSRRRSTGGQRRPGSRDVRESRRTTQNTPAQAGAVPAPVSTPLRPVGSVPRRRPSKDPLQSSRRMTQSVQMGFKESRANERSSFEDNIVTTEVTRLDLKQGPKTPVAMVLVGDKEKPHAAEASGMTSLGIKGTNIIRPSRPRSAIW